MLGKEIEKFIQGLEAKRSKPEPFLYFPNLVPKVDLSVHDYEYEQEALKRVEAEQNLRNLQSEIAEITKPYYELLHLTANQAYEYFPHSRGLFARNNFTFTMPTLVTTDKESYNRSGVKLNFHRQDISIIPDNFQLIVAKQLDCLDPVKKVAMVELKTKDYSLDEVSLHWPAVDENSHDIYPLLRCQTYFSEEHVCIKFKNPTHAVKMLIELCHPTKKISRYNRPFFDIDRDYYRLAGSLLLGLQKNPFITLRLSEYPFDRKLIPPLPLKFTFQYNNQLNRFKRDISKLELLQIREYGLSEEEFLKPDDYLQLLKTVLKIIPAEEFNN